MPSGNLAASTEIKPEFLPRESVVETDRTHCLIRAANISKSFGVVRALNGVTAEFARGEVHGLVGANGAGKSTLLNVLGGIIQPDAGEIVVDGEPIRIASRRDSMALGFSFIWQELALVGEFSAIDNMTLGLQSGSFLGLREKKRRRMVAEEAAALLDIKFDLQAPVRKLSVAERGLVAIGRALTSNARFIAMDEPTASLSDVECERLFEIVNDLRARGISIAYVSHRLDEVEQLCDAVTVFRDGAVIARYRRNEYSRSDLVRGIVGTAGTIAERAPRAKAFRHSDEVLRVDGLARGSQVKDVSFSVHKGEILGLAGVVGAGRTEVLQLVFGADRADAGEMVLDGAAYSPRTTFGAVQSGVGLLPEERRSQGLILADSITENVNLGNWEMSRWRPRLPLISPRLAAKRASAAVEELAVKARSVNSPVRTLSGGNQQKVVFARWLARGVHLLLLDEPTRGVDVGARQQIWDAVTAFVATGGSAIVVSSELDELAICDRIVVIVEGRTTGEIEGPGVTEAQMLEQIYAQQNLEPVK